jgi:hypothetical protein
MNTEFIGYFQTLRFAEPGRYIERTNRSTGVHRKLPRLISVLPTADSRQPKASESPTIAITWSSAWLKTAIKRVRRGGHF